ncbi:exosortase K [Marinobacter daqiaonensis]|uniref:Exosortase K n=1 Tax=Marinobacter daqiaonensis TaxID=650891 RepID=A0A1I6HVK3_9GAMM|nr:exosortase/archaeosortase family protein [Marinobacter daqiaonensis]SFR58473.1 exosortase K [Marinobacter daqiaonensis]
MLRKTLENFPLARPYFIIVALALALFYPTWLRLAVQWLEFEQVLAHGLPTFLIFIGLLIIHPPRPVRDRENGFSIAGGISLLLVTLCWALLELVRIDTLAYLTLPFGMLALCWSLLGFQAGLRFLPYVLLFSLSLPIWSDLVPFLVDLATFVVSNLVAMMGITALIEGPNITLPYGRLVIADGCSGIRYFAISILLAMIMSILNDFRWKGWLAAIAIGMAIALVVNWVRITALVVIAYQSNMESDLVTDHETFGWLVYLAFLVPAMWLAPVYRRGQPANGHGPAVSPEAFGFVVVAFLAGPLGISLVHSAAGESPAWELSLPGATSVPPGQMPLSITLPDPMTLGVWRADNSVWIAIGQTRKDSRQDKLVPYLSRTIDTDGWFLESRHDGNIRVYQHLTNRKKVVVSERYQVGQYATHSYSKAKLLQIPATLSGENRFALVTLQSPCGPRDCEQTIERVRELKDNLTL